VPTSLYLINPEPTFPSLWGSAVMRHFGFEKSTVIADLATVTVAALAPSDFRIEICDENVTPIDFDHPAEIIGITGKLSQFVRMRQIAEEFRKRGKVIMVGGPDAALDPDKFRTFCDILVRGEMEDIAAELFADIREGRWKREYCGGKPDLSSSPVPRWDLYPNDRATTGCIQTSRGCPFECEFCDVIQYLGRKQRHKAVEQVIAELEVLRDLGYKSVFLADDNFTVFRRRAKELLHALAEWNSRAGERGVHFSTQLSIDAARDDEMLALCAEARLVYAFVGIETPNEESLRETKKRQNVGIDLADEIQALVDHGILVTAGLIAGFDSDDVDIFERLFRFAMSTAVPNLTINTLNAPAATPLRARLEKDNRLLPDNDEIYSHLFWTNIVPKRMTSEELYRGTLWLANNLYHPANFARRMLRFVETAGRRVPARYAAHHASHPQLRAVEEESLRMPACIAEFGPDEARMVDEVFRALRRNPAVSTQVLMALHGFAQYRYRLEFAGVWDPSLVGTPSPAFV
jgi:radical SAM superfamily enzyme YgiQ (UPF0313 family)